MILGMGVALRLRQDSDWAWVGALGLCMAAQGLENPYLTPVLPLFFVLLLILQTRGQSPWSWSWSWSDWHCGCGCDSSWRHRTRL